MKKNIVYLGGDHVSAPSWLQKSSAPFPPPPQKKAINDYGYPEHVNKLCGRVLVITSLLANLMGKYVLPFTRKIFLSFKLKVDVKLVHTEEKRKAEFGPPPFLARFESDWTLTI